MRLDHLLSKRKSKGWIAVDLSRGKSKKETETEETETEHKTSGVDALMGNTRTHPEHDG